MTEAEPTHNFSKKLKISSKAIKIVYILFASCLLCYGFYSTIQTLIDGNILVKEQVRVFPDIKYPSVTFCYKYRYGSKNAMQAYNLYFDEKWKKSGEGYIIFQIT